MKDTWKVLKSLLLSRYYPMVNPHIDVRYRLPRKELSKMRVLNVGVGDGFSGLARQLPFIEFGSLTMIDVHQPYLDHAEMKTWDAREIKFVNADVRDYPVEDFDLVLTFDVLEHITKEEAVAVMQRIKGKHVIFGPLETSYRHNHFEVESQDHKSLWTEEDFIDLGYKTEVLKDFHREEDEIFDALWALK
jgi:2-polyprenyl-3-methyl-5-hydroxy-6-metoxy-1,4-benzoquinol methylase